MEYAPGEAKPPPAFVLGRPRAYPMRSDVGVIVFTGMSCFPAWR